MNTFITGKLEQNNAGATYEGEVYDRNLLVQLPDNQLLAIFDMRADVEPLSSTLSEGEIYTFILVPFTGGVIIAAPSKRLTSINVADVDGLWQGEIVDLHWKAPQKYRLSRSSIYKYEWILLSTPIGHILMDTDDVRLPVNVGTILQWKRGRLDLYGIV